MRHILPLVAALLLVVFSADAQRTVLGDRFQVNSFGSFLGLNMDYHRDMSIDWMRHHTADPSVIRIDAENAEVHNYGEVVGAMFGASVGLSPKSRKSSEYNYNQELIVSANIITGREALVTYDTYDTETNDLMRYSTMFCLMDNELNLNIDYQFSHTWSIFKFNAGAGVSAGSTFGCKMLIMRSRYVDWGPESWDTQNFNDVRQTNNYEDELYDGVCSMFLRGYGTAGAGFLIAGHVEIGAQVRLGMGTEYLYGTNLSPSIINGAFLTGVKYHIPKINQKRKPITGELFD